MSIERFESKEGWSEWRKIIYDNIKHLEFQVDESRKEHKLQIKELDALNIDIERTLGDIKVEISKLKVKAGVWGTIGASIPVSILLILRTLGL